MTKILETKILCKQDERYIGWPTVARSPDGILYAAFSGDRDAHICPFGKSFLMRSEDEGKTWSDPVVVNDTPLDDRDTGLCVCPDGTLVMTWFTSYFSSYMYQHRENTATIQDFYTLSENVWAERVREMTPEAISKWAPNKPYPDNIGTFGGIGRTGYWCRRSRDNGRTWDAPTATPVSAPHGPTVMPNGDLLYVGSDGEFIGAALSSDQGISWKVLSRISVYPAGEGTEEEAFFCEPHVTRTRSGKLVAMTRYERQAVTKDLWQFESEDGGLTWTKPTQTGIVGFPPHLLTLRDGRLMVSYAVRHDSPGQRACISSDEGKNWKPCLSQSAPSGDLGYPSTVECSDGTFLSVYYQPVTASEKPSLMMTRFSLTADS